MGEYMEQVYFAVAMPLQGFINWAIYVLPAVTRYLDEHPIRSWTCRTNQCRIPFGCFPSKVSSANVSSDPEIKTNADAVEHHAGEIVKKEDRERGNDEEDHVWNMSMICLFWRGREKDNFGPDPAPAQADKIC